MSQFDELYGRLPIAQLAQQVGADEQQTDEAVRTVLPALLGGLQRNAEQPEGAASLLEALGEHQSRPLAQREDVDLGEVDTQDGEKIVNHVFGGQQDNVVQQLGGFGGGSGLISKLLPILAPIVLSFLAKKLGGGGGLLPQGGGGGLFPQQQAQPQQQAGGQDMLGGLLQDMLGGALGGAPSNRQPQSGGGGGLGDLLGGILRGGR